MPITALPSNTVHAIGSSQVLADSASLVKELVDNALDGRARAIFVDISTNALDIIQVKDNGHGIAPEDRGMLCKRYCTSKIRDLEDLTKVGGQSLGFRGEALASAAEMSGSILVSTRVEGEPTATAIKVKREGGIESEEKISHPVGTTVRVVNFLKTIPVRRQTALRAPAKLLSKIKKMLQAYALARPSVRFSLKVLKAKNDKGNWIYAPKSGAALEEMLMDAAIKVVGKKVTEQSTWKTWSPSSIGDKTATTKVEAAGSDLYKIEALLPIPACDTSYISNVGQFVSVDSRPVSCARGALKQMISLYKSYLRFTNSPSKGQNLIDPFLYMNITCPQGSYDVNVEPAKDDVLFTDNYLFLNVIESFFISVYGEPGVTATNDVRLKPSKLRSQDFELLLARKPPLTVATIQKQVLEGDTSGHVEDTSLAASSMSNRAGSIPLVVPDPDARTPDICTRITTGVQLLSQSSPRSEHVLQNEDGPARFDKPVGKVRPPNRNMYADDDDAVDELHLTVEEHDKQPAEPELDDEGALRDIHISNPWAFAKINAPIRPLRKGREAQTVIVTNSQLWTPVSQRGEASDGLNRSDSHHKIEDTVRRELPTPEASLVGVSSRSGLQFSSPEPFPYPLKAWGKGDGSRTARRSPVPNRERYGCGALDTWVQKSLGSHSSTPGPDEISLQDSDYTGANRPKDFVSARTLPMGTPFNDIPTAAPRSSQKPGPRKQHRPNINNNIVSPVNDPEQVWFDLEPKRRSKTAKPARATSGEHKIAPNATIRRDSEGDDFVPEHPSNASSVEPVHPDLASIMDYELRKQAAFEHHKKCLRQQAAAAAAKTFSPNHADDIFCSQTPHASPYKNRYHKAIAALHPVDHGLASSDPTPAFEPGDPRAYLIHAQQRDNAELRTDPAGISPVKKRRKTALLPLETVREDRSTRNLTLQLSTTLHGFKNQVSQAAISDQYVTTGNTHQAFSATTITQVRAWEQKLRALISTSHGNGEQSGGDGARAEETRIDLWPALQAHLEACS